MTAETDKRVASARRIVTAKAKALGGNSQAFSDLLYHLGFSQFLHVNELGSITLQGMRDEELVMLGAGIAFVDAAGLQVPPPTDKDLPF